VSLAATLLAAQPANPYRGPSLLRGWLPGSIEAVTATVLLLAIGWRTQRWRLLWLPLAALVGIAAASWAHWYVDAQGLADDPAPAKLWIWIGLTALAIGVLFLGWHNARWWRRGASLLAVLLCALSSGVALNLWVGYFPTVVMAWNQLTAGPLPRCNTKASSRATAPLCRSPFPRTRRTSSTAPSSYTCHRHGLRRTRSRGFPR
jgi:hypothetical protein